MPRRNTSAVGVLVLGASLFAFCPGYAQQPMPGYVPMPAPQVYTPQAPAAPGMAPGYAMPGGAVPGVGAPTGPGVDTPTGPISFQTFYDALAPQGRWIQTNNYGYVWQPNINDPNWAPYTNGHWVYTADGWTWVSDEPWGWATYHYGRWVNLDNIGWCWVPGYTWGPAWVSWRYGNGYCGWAPLPPDSLVGTDYDSDDEDDAGFHIGGDCDDYYGIGAGWYNFIPVADFGDADYRGYYVNRYNNYRLINRTTNVTNMNLNRDPDRAAEPGGNFQGVSLGGPSLVQIDAMSQTPVPRVNLVTTDRVGGGTVENNSLALFAPTVDPATLAGSRPETVAGNAGQAVVNRGVDITHPLMVNSHLSVTPPTARQIQEAQMAQFNAPARAKIATADMPVHSVAPRSLALQADGSRAYAPRYYSAATGVAGRTVAPTPGVAGRTVYQNGQGYSRTYPSGGVYRGSASPSAGEEYRGAGSPSAGGYRDNGGGGYNGGGAYSGGGGAYRGGGVPEGH